MSFQARIAAISALAVAIALVIASGVAYVAAGQSLRGEVDDDLVRTAAEMTANQRGRLHERLDDQIRQGVVRELLERAGVRIFDPAPITRFGGATAFAQVVDFQGQVVTLGGDLGGGPVDFLPVGGEARDVAAGEFARSFETIDVDGESVRVYTRPLVPGIALQVARPLTEVDAALSDLAVRLGVGSAIGVGVAALLGLGVAHWAIRPMQELTESAEHVAQTRDLSVRMEGKRKDEIGRLSRSFNTMLEALQRSEESQRQLIADASHELRTPITSLRTNLEVLNDVEGLSPEDRGRLIDDVVGQFDELNLLISDLVDAAREREQVEDMGECDMGQIVKAVVERIRRRYPQVEFVVDAEPYVVNGVTRRLERAVTNLLDNAGKWSPPGGVVELALGNGLVTIRDRGPGFDEVDLPHVFDRFYRASSVRSMPGSGLGLAIVAQVAESHGGSVSARNHPDGGAVVELRIPPA
jgi:two-component system sensor histidine kinase MprB